MRLIDADKMLKRIESWNTSDSMDKALYNFTLNRIIEQPTVDAVPVIRCKNCKLWMKNPYRESSVFGLCFKHKDIAIASDETDWCSWAERRNDETD